ncbi:MAG: helix-turn-helix transcriptional regulator [Methylocella sp.]
MAKELETAEGVIDSSGNVFADLGLPCSEEDMLKVRIAHAITATIQEKNISQMEAAKLIGTDQAKVSNLLRGRLKGFSTDRLIHMLVQLGRDVDIHISEAKQRAGRIRVEAA